LSSLKVPVVAKEARSKLRLRIATILNSQASDEQKEARILKAVDDVKATLPKKVFDELVKLDNPIADQVRSGSRGSPANLARLVAGDLLYVDHRGETIPIPAITSYSEGLPPAEWFSASFGARAGLRDVKFATQDAGYFSKQLNQANHRLMITQDDDPDEPTNIRGLPVDVTDMDNEGALLAHAVGDYPRNTVLTPKIMKDLNKAGVKRILVRSPTVGGPAHGGVYAKDVGIRERGGFSPLGDNVGLAAAQALGEKIVQGGLSSKHVGGVKGAVQAVSGFDRINQFIQVPKRFKGGAAHSQEDGFVDSITKTATGHYNVVVNGKPHFVQAGFNPIVKQGEKIEAGDVLSEGLPNPAEIVKYKGVGEGRRYFIRSFTSAYRDAGLGVDRRNVELLARGLIDHVQLTAEDDDHIPGDVVAYSQLESTWNDPSCTIR
jgi:DNA-directed RNA polymerase subunit beta'